MIAGDYLKKLNVFVIESDDGLMIPADGYHHVSFDFASGMSGIAAFGNRMKNDKSGRKFFIDEMMEEEKYEMDLA